MNPASLFKAGTAAALLGASPLMAQTENQKEWDDWRAANSETVSAERMMAGDVKNQFNLMGNVSDLVLDPTGTRIEYVLYEIPYPWSFYGDDDGFVRWANIAVERGTGTSVDLEVDDEASAYAKNQLQITRSEAGDRLASRIVGSNIMFADGAIREIDDILFDPETGTITDYVVEMDEDSLFDEDTRRIPASLVTLDAEGQLLVSQPVTYRYEVWVY